MKGVSSEGKSETRTASLQFAWGLGRSQAGTAGSFRSRQWIIGSTVRTGPNMSYRRVGLDPEAD